MLFETMGNGVLKGALDATRDEVLNRWAADPAFALSFSAAIAQAPFEGLYFETPPLTVESLALPFECVLVDGPELAGLRADPSPFGDALRSPAAIVAFENLRRDAILVSPTPADGVDCAHLAAFLRSARDSQKVELWRAVSAAMLSVVGVKPRWLSTAGLGVSWLHVRIDSAPKYYRHRPYR